VSKAIKMILGFLAKSQPLYLYHISISRVSALHVAESLEKVFRDADAHLVRGASRYHEVRSEAHGPFPTLESAEPKRYGERLR
jgi:hypothetical protein